MVNESSGYNEQSEVWNGTAGRAWVEAQELLDGMFKPIEDLLVQAVLPEVEREVLDVGCGAGSTTLAVSRRLGTEGRCVGIDISLPMIERARARAKQGNLSAAFICNDAQRHCFEPDSFDLILSRFGVMFFDDSVAAFKNLRHAARIHAELRFVAWRSAEENPFMTTAERAAATLLPNMPERLPDEPGQFAFARKERIHDILRESGWGSIRIEPVDFLCTFPEKELVTYLTRLGPLGRILHEVDGQLREKVIETVRAAFEPYVDGDTVSFSAACWNVRACVL